ncbi:tRNA lysidine(34) synthetase TilS [Vibrio algarum]|uniref:tRNA(Ile)-lysidine synthase n=1 Tax=Vibrio algarum TaxID=3020714 RepID=A0ABT4YUA5_9VIBR|nr:tRNA lysidine(34) synthetase TilS [Vibrio sp. KJ40-1]MDB1124603.1 tRNA lysidine(34) synthetase TilS [Vibrio sp. KJ40-1]
MLDTLTSIIEKYHQPDGRIVLALSGGVDSRVLLDLLARYKATHNGITCLAVHVHHGLSDNANEWAERCSLWCRDYGIELFIEHVELNLARNVSIEQEARNKRYQALEKHVKRNDLLLTGQHNADQLETFLLAMKRGSGPKGLSAMPECTSFAKGYLVRPLLTISQAEIVGYANLQGLSWNEDESNQDIRYDRNFLRQEVIPSLKSRWPNIEQSVLRSSQLCADQESLINELLHDRLVEFTAVDGGLSISQLRHQSELARNQLLRLWLGSRKSIMPSFVQLSLIWNEVAMAKADANPRMNITSGEVRRFKDRLYFVERLSDVSSWSEFLPSNQWVELPEKLGRIQLTDKSTETPLSLRSPRDDEQVQVHFKPQGLTAHPVERGHSRKLKKLFQEYGVPSWLRTRTPIIMYGDQLAMVVDLFVCKEFHGDDCEILWDKV